MCDVEFFLFMLSKKRKNKNKKGRRAYPHSNNTLFCQDINIKLYDETIYIHVYIHTHTPTYFYLVVELKSKYVNIIKLTSK